MNVHEDSQEYNTGKALLFNSQGKQVPIEKPSQPEEATHAQSSLLGEGLDLLSLDLVEGKHEAEPAFIKHDSGGTNLYRCPRCKGADFKKRDGAILVCKGCGCVLQDHVENVE